MMDYTCHIVKVKILEGFCVVYGMADQQTLGTTDHVQCFQT